MKKDILVEALDTYEKNNIQDKELHFIPKEGKQFKVCEKRLKELLGDNDYELIFVKVITEEKEEKKPRKK